MKVKNIIEKLKEYEDSELDVEISLMTTSADIQSGIVEVSVNNPTEFFVVDLGNLLSIHISDKEV